MNTQDRTETNNLKVNNSAVFNRTVCIKRNGGCGTGLRVDAPAVFTSTVNFAGATQVDYQDSVTVYANAGTGSDSNDGLTSVTAVQTIPKALEVLSCYTGGHGIIQLEGATIFDLGTNPTLDFHQVVVNFQKVTVQGTRTNETTGTVVTIGDSGPFDSWKNVDIGQTLTVDEYAKGFAYNVTQNRRYVIKDNTATVVNAITGNSAKFAPEQGGEGSSADSRLRPLITRTSRQNSWYVGDSVILYHHETEMTYTGVLEVCVPYGQVAFEDININGALSSTWCNACKTPISFRGCRIATTVSMPSGVPDDTLPSFQGSADLFGCHLEGIGDFSTFNRLEVGEVITSESVYIDRTVIFYAADSYSQFCYAYDVGKMMSVLGAAFYSVGLLMEETQADAHIWIYGANAYFVDTVITAVNERVPGKNGYGFVIDTQCVVSVYNIDVTLPQISRTTHSVVVEENARLRFSGTTVLAGSIGLTIGNDSRVFFYDLLSSCTISNIDPRTSGTGFSFESNCAISFMGTDDFRPGNLLSLPPSAVITSVGNNDAIRMRSEQNTLRIGRFTTINAGRRGITAVNGTNRVSCNNSIVIGTGLNLTAAGDRGIVVADNTKLTFEGTVTANVTGPSAIFLVATRCCDVNIFGGLNITATGNGVSLSDNSRLAIQGSTTVNTGGTFLLMNRGCNVTSNIAGLVNAGAGAELDLGGLGIVAWATNNDLGAGSPENCFFYTF